jgi:hypothetical protein
MRRFVSVAAGTIVLGVCLSGTAAPVASAGSSKNPAVVRIPASLVVDRKLGASAAGVAELKFQDVFKLPAGPKGLEATPRLLELDGKRVRIVGFMVRQESPAIDSFLFSPLPVQLGDEDESLADDLPPSTIRVELPTSHGVVVPTVPGLLQLTGVLHVGMRADPASGRATPALLTLDPRPERALRRLAHTSTAKNGHAPHQAR